MTGDSCSLVSKETRLPLCDMTNVPSKRGISSILGDFLLKSGDDAGKAVAAREGSGVKFSKRLCLVVDDLVKESTRTSDTNDGSSSDDKISFGDSPPAVVDADSENFDVKESQGETNAVDIGVQHSGGAVVELGQRECGKDSNVGDFSSQTDAVTGEDLTVTVFSSSNCESDGRLAMVAAEGTGLLPSSETIKPFNMSRCSAVDNMGMVNRDMEADDELKSCSCSFCLKAAYIWSDLHYQDIKGRLSVLKKSQKEASSLIRRNGKGRPTDVYGSENSNHSTNVEFDVMGQWTSLFLNMEGILARESSHLQDSFVTMKELRENCKIDLERATKTPQ
ncbi:DNA-directed RNA polymerase subunit beta [Hirschfeldia incana]|nr:DNA-directed RNA polymerase subunit beta [Hirschfeldia incana]